MMKTTRPQDCKTWLEQNPEFCVLYLINIFYLYGKPAYYVKRDFRR
jgi:hypothetical protein